jgi:hypothetical protein
VWVDAEIEDPSEDVLLWRNKAVEDELRQRQKKAGEDVADDNDDNFINLRVTKTQKEQSDHFVYQFIKTKFGNATNIESDRIFEIGLKLYHIFYVMHLF